MCSSIVISLLESDFLEAAINNLVECRHSSVANCHAPAKPVEHYMHSVSNSSNAAHTRPVSSKPTTSSLAVTQSHCASLSPNSIAPTSPKLPHNTCHEDVSGKSAICHREVADMDHVRAGKSRGFVPPRHVKTV